MNEKSQENHSSWRNTTIIAGIVATIDFAIISFGVLLNQGTEFTTWSLSSVGIITFFGMLIICSHHAKYSPDSKGIMRKSLTASLISVYIVVLSLALSGTFGDIQDEMTKSVLSNFSIVVITIVGFYFGAKGISEIVKR
jgi:hypothetical protein